MYRLRTWIWAVGLLAGTLLPASAAPLPSEKTSGEVTPAKLHTLLDKVVDLDIKEQGLSKAIEQLRDQTGVPFALYPADYPVMQLGGVAPGVAPGGTDFPQLTFKATKVKLRQALNRGLAPHGLTHVILGDKVYIASIERANHEQMRQKVNVNLNEAKLNGALKQLALDTASNIVLDPKLGKSAEEPITLQLDNVPLEVAVKVIATAAGLASVRMHNVLYVTTLAKAKELRQEAQELQPPVALPGQFGPMMNPFGVIGNLNVGLIGLMGQFGVMGGLPGAAPPPPVPPEKPKEEPKKDPESSQSGALSPDHSLGEGTLTVSVAVGLLVTSFSVWARRRRDCRESTDRVI